MANRTSHRRILAAPQPEPKASMDPTLKRHTKPSTSQHLWTNPDPTMPSKPSSMSNTTSRVNPSQRVRTSQRPNCQQAKAMSVSAIMDSSISMSSLFSNPNSEKQSKPAKELALNDKANKPTKELDRKKVGETVVVKKMKEVHKELMGFEEEHVVDSMRRLSVSSNGGVGRRRSLNGSQVQLADVFASNGVKVVSADMPPFMQIHAVECARKTHDSLEKFTSKTLALTLKKEFDGVYGPAWHCIVGTSFGSFVTHSSSGFLYFSMDQKLYILLFKTTVRRAD